MWYHMVAFCYWTGETPSLASLSFVQQQRIMGPSILPWSSSPSASPFHELMLLNTICVPVISRSAAWIQPRLNLGKTRVLDSTQMVVYPFFGTPPSNKKECNINAYNHLGKFQKHCAKYRKSNLENSVFCDCISVYVQS